MVFSRRAPHVASNARRFRPHLRVRRSWPSASLALLDSLRNHKRMTTQFARQRHFRLTTLQDRRRRSPKMSVNRSARERTTVTPTPVRRLQPGGGIWEAELSRGYGDASKPRRIEHSTHTHWSPAMSERHRPTSKPSPSSTRVAVAREEWLALTLLCSHPPAESRNSTAPPGQHASCSGFRRRPLSGTSAN